MDSNVSSNMSYQDRKKNRTLEHNKKKENKKNKNKYSRTTYTNFRPIYVNPTMIGIRIDYNDYKNAQDAILNLNEVYSWGSGTSYVNSTVCGIRIGNNDYKNARDAILNSNEVYSCGSRTSDDDDMPDILPARANIKYAYSDILSNPKFYADPNNIILKEIKMSVDHKEDDYRPALLRDNGLSFRYCAHCTDLRENGKSSRCEHGGTGTLAITNFGKTCTFRVHVNHFRVCRKHMCHRPSCIPYVECEHNTSVMQTEYYFTPLEDIPSIFLMSIPQFDTFINHTEKLKYLLNELPYDIVRVICGHFLQSFDKEWK